MLWWPQNLLRGESVVDVATLNKALKKRVTNITQYQQEVAKVLKEKNKGSKVFTKALTFKAVVGANKFQMVVTYNEETTVGTLRQRVIDAINRVLKSKGQKTLPKALARRLSISFGGIDMSEHGRAGVKVWYIHLHLPVPWILWERSGFLMNSAKKTG